LGRGGSGGKGIGKGKRREATGAEGGYKILLSCYIARCQKHLQSVHIGGCRHPSAILEGCEQVIQWCIYSLSRGGKCGELCIRVAEMGLVIDASVRCSP